jgi:hypothetical protein
VIPTLDHEAHEYRLNGQRLWSVTQILGGLGLLRDLSFLDPFYRQRGSATHAAVDWDFEGAEHVQPRFQRFERLREAAGLKPILFEQPLASSTFFYAGTEDYFGPYLNHPYALLDWKGDSLEPGHGLQVAGGYRGLLYEAALSGFLDVDPNDVLHAPCFLVPLGGKSDLPSVRPIPDFDGNAMALFRGAAAVWNWRCSNLGEPK